MTEITHEAVTEQLKSLAAELTERRKRLEDELKTVNEQLESTIAAIKAMSGNVSKPTTARRNPRPRGSMSHKTQNDPHPQCVVSTTNGELVAYQSKTKALKGIGISSGTFYSHTDGLMGSFGEKSWVIVPDVPINGLEILDTHTGISYPDMRKASVGAGVVKTDIALDLVSEGRRFSLVTPEAD